MNKEKLQELRDQQFPRFDWHDILRAKEGKSLDDVISKEEQEKLTEYFSHFADDGFAARHHFGMTVPCIGCNLEMDNSLVGSLFNDLLNRTRLEWSLAHGEAYCITCDWPYRVYHRDITP